MQHPPCRLLFAPMIGLTAGDEVAFGHVGDGTLKLRRARPDQANASSDPLRRKPRLSHDPKHIEAALFLCELAVFNFVHVTSGKFNGLARARIRLAPGAFARLRVGSRQRPYGAHPIALAEDSLSCELQVGEGGEKALHLVAMRREALGRLGSQIE